MIEKICNLLMLNINAGLGLRLAEAEIRLDSGNAHLYYIQSKNIVDTTSLTVALMVQVKKLRLNICFKPMHILVY